MEESEAKYNMQLASLTENLALNKADLTATQVQLMEVVKQNDELRALNIELETKLEASSDDRRMLWDRYEQWNLLELPQKCIASICRTKFLKSLRGKAFYCEFGAK